MKNFLLTLLLATFSFGAQADCSFTNSGNIPLPEMGLQTYGGFPGGLYPDFANQPPPAHRAAGLSIATNQIKPLNAFGNVDTNSGKIVLLSIGLSNTTQQWASKGNEHFRALANADPAKNPQVLIVDGAQGGQASMAWTNFTADTWTTVEQRLSAAGVTTNQVQVIWMKHARGQPFRFGDFPAHAQALQADLEIIMRHARSRYPNLKIAYISSRTRSYQDDSSTLNPEPYAYEAGFSTKWLIEKQINGEVTLNFDPAQGTVVAPWLAWGPYLWSDGTVRRSDGFTWLCSDVENDLTHPTSTGGVPKVARQLLAFFKTDPTATPWFLKKTIIGQPPNCIISANVTNGLAPLVVDFMASANDPDGTIRDYYWTFDDGTFSTNASPKKIFKAPRVYTARLTVTDNHGNTVTRSLPIHAPALFLGSPELVNGQLQVSITGTTNFNYVVQRSSDLAAWFSVVTNRGSFTFADTNTVENQRFYRVTWQP